MHHFRSNHFDPSQNFHPIVLAEIAAVAHFVVDNHPVVAVMDKNKTQLDTVDIVAEGTEKEEVVDTPLHNHFAVVVAAAAEILRVVEEKTLTD